MEQEKNSFSACQQGCTLKIGHRVFTLCSSDFIINLNFFLYRAWLAYRKTISLDYIVYV